MVEVLQKAMDFGLSWVATIALAFYVYNQHQQSIKAIKESSEKMQQEQYRHRDEVKELTKEYTDKVAQITENYTTEVAKLRESVDNNTATFKVLYDLLIANKKE